LKSSNSLNGRDDHILIGRVVGAHGIRGSIKIRSFAESLSVYETQKGLRVVPPGGAMHTMTVQWVRPHGRLLLMKLEAVTDRDQAERLIGSALFVDKSALPTLGEDTYYWFDLVGLRVYDATGVMLGRLDRIIPTPGDDIYVVKGKQGGQPTEMLLPAVGDVILKIDLAGKTMIVDPPDGL
jgi:16S rRNA processing protein RimM